MPATNPKNRRKILIAAAMGVVILSGLAVSAYWLNNKPRAQRTPPKSLAPLVETVSLTPVEHLATVSAMGVVTAAQSVDLAARVSGEVVAVNDHLAPGARFAKGEMIARIDPADYRLALREKEAALVKARYELELELGQGAVAKREYELLGETIAESDRALVLREPHLKAARANVDAAEAALEQARLELERTQIVAPFNAVVKERFVAVGMQLGSGTKIATLVDSDRYWIEASLPIDHLAWIRFGNDPSRVEIIPRIPGTHYREGFVKSVMSDVDEEGRMARIVIEVSDPLSSTAAAPLLLGDLVTLGIEGKRLENVLKIPRSAVHNGGSIWLLSPEKRLKIVHLTPLWAETDAIFIDASAIADGFSLITTDLSGAVEGMQLRTEKAQ